MFDVHASFIHRLISLHPPRTASQEASEDIQEQGLPPDTLRHDAGHLCSPLALFLTH
jgi:hypothetical protein